MSCHPAVHEPVDLARWIAQFPLDRHWKEIQAQNGPDFWYNAPDDIFSPRDLALTEQLRQRAGFQHHRDTKPVDVLLPAWGEPSVPFASKVGGVPYIRRGEWPLGQDGQPLVFHAQLCFADSRDQLPVPELPADVLLIFEEFGEEMDTEFPLSGLHFEWREIGIPRKHLMQAEDMPREPTWTPTHFHRFRSFESDETRSVDHPRGPIWVSGAYTATKIGGIPVHLQGAEEAEGLGIHLASLHSINPGDRDYPFPNLPQAPWKNPWDAGLLNFGDIGTLYLYVSAKGVICGLMQCS